MTERRYAFTEYDMKLALVRTARKLFGREAPVAEEIYGARFLPALPVSVFSRDRKPDAGMREFLCGVLARGEQGANAVFSFMGGYDEKEREAIATSLVAVLINTRSEAALFMCLEAAERLKSVSGPDAALAFVKQCALADFGENAMKECNALFRDGYVCEVPGHVLGMADESTAKLDAQSFFNAMLRISSIGGFGERADRKELAREFALTMRTLLSNCPEAAGIFAEDFSAVMRPEGGAPDAHAYFESGLRLVRSFRDGLIMSELRLLRGDTARIEQRIAEFLETEQ